MVQWLTHRSRVTSMTTIWNIGMYFLKSYQFHSMAINETLLSYRRLWVSLVREASYLSFRMRESKNLKYHIAYGKMIRREGVTVETDIEINHDKTICHANLIINFDKMRVYLHGVHSHWWSVPRISYARSVFTMLLLYSLRAQSRDLQNIPWIMHKVGALLCRFSHFMFFFWFPSRLDEWHK